MIQLIPLVQPGLVTYAKGLELQQQARKQVVRGKIPGALILLEHYPVITTGRAGGREHLTASGSQLKLNGIDYFESDRGGNVTCHNPGQLVVYPVLNLSCWQEDVHWYVEQLEEVLIQTLKSQGIIAGRKQKYTGVWAGDRKIAAIGVSVRRWVTGHGAALNVCNDLSLFQQIVPCGIQEFGVVSLRSLGVSSSVEAVSQQLVTSFTTVFDVTLRNEKEADLFG